MSKEEKFPNLTEKDKRAINDCFTHYLFFKSTSSGKEFWCTACNEHFELEGRGIRNNLEYDALTRNHNDCLRCPRCGKHVTVKNLGRSKTRQNLWEEQRIVILRVKSPNKIIAQCYECTKTYVGCILPYAEAHEVSRYILTPGKARKFSYSYYSGWGECLTAREPFQVKSGIGHYSPPDNSYTVLGLERLYKSFLKYHMLEDYSAHQPKGCGVRHVKIMSYLCRFAERPQIEMLQKLGHYDVVRALVEDNKKSYPFVNWKAKSPAAFFKLSNQEYKLFKDYGGTLDILKARRELHSIGFDGAIKTTAEILSTLQSSDPAYWLSSDANKARNRGLDPYTCFKYFIKQCEKNHNTLRFISCQYFDYYDAAKAIGYDLDDSIVLFPKNLIYHHDRATETHRVMLEQKREEEHRAAEQAAKEQLERNDKQYAFSKDGFVIIVPHSIEEIIREGKLQHHCVGGYAGRHMEGKLTICFLRSESAPEEPLYTIEMHNKELTQVQGYGNHTPLTAEAKKFFKVWLSWVKAGSRRSKSGKPIIKKPITA